MFGMIFKCSDCLHLGKVTGSDIDGCDVAWSVSNLAWLSVSVGIDEQKSGKHLCLGEVRVCVFFLGMFDGLSDFGSRGSSIVSFGAQPNKLVGMIGRPL